MPETTPPQGSAAGRSTDVQYPDKTDHPAASTVTPAAGGVGPAAAEDVHVGKYGVIERLGAGGQGEVFRAVHPGLGRDVILKIAQPGLSPVERQSVLAEGRVLAKLDLPGLV